ncbi:MAG: hypothetical protein JO284_10730 [Planctomycetaceae bacterium]|nr:hypothetical protein [Planctomycetaceae bacterium]
MLVKAIAIDDQDRVKLSRKAALAELGQPDEYAKAHPASERPAGDRGTGGPPRRDRDRDRDRGPGGGRGGRDRD